MRITSEATGMPIASSMDVQVLGCLDNGMPVYWSTTALQAASRRAGMEARRSAR